MWEKKACFFLMWSHQWVIDVTANFPPRFSFSSLLYFRLYVYQLFPLKTAIGLFLFLSFDAQVRGTGDVVNSLKSEGGWGAGSRALWVVASAGCLTGHDERSCCLSLKMEAPVLLYSPCGVTADSDSPKPKWMNEPVLLLWLFFHVLNLYLPVSHTGECLCGGGPMAQLLRLGDVAVLVCRRLAPARCTACRWAPQCTSERNWSCWYWGWTWLWTDWWPARTKGRETTQQLGRKQGNTKRLTQIYFFLTKESCKLEYLPVCSETWLGSRGPSCTLQCYFKLNANLSTLMYSKWKC